MLFVAGGSARNKPASGIKAGNVAGNKTALKLSTASTWPVCLAVICRGTATPGKAERDIVLGIRVACAPEVIVLAIIGEKPWYAT